MPHTIKWEKKGVLVNYENMVDIHDVVQSNYSMFNDIRLDKIEYKIIDFTKVRNVYLKEQDLIVAATLNNVSISLANTVKFAVVTKNNNLKKLSKMFIEHLDESAWEGQIFPTITDARKWIMNKQAINKK